MTSDLILISMTSDLSIYWINHLSLGIFSVDSVTHPLNNWDLAPIIAVWWTNKRAQERLFAQIHWQLQKRTKIREAATQFFNYKSKQERVWGWGMRNHMTPWLLLVTLSKEMEGPHVYKAKHLSGLKTSLSDSPPWSKTWHFDCKVYQIGRLSHSSRCQFDVWNKRNCWEM